MGARALECRTEASALPNSGTTILGVPTRCHTCGSLLSWHLLTIPCESGRVSLWQHLPTQNGARMGGGGPGPCPDSAPPAPQYSRQEQEEEGRKRYEAQKLERMGTRWRDGDIAQPVPNPGECGAGGRSLQSGLRGRWGLRRLQIEGALVGSNSAAHHLLPEK